MLRAKLQVLESRLAARKPDPSTTTKTVTEKAGAAPDADEAKRADAAKAQREIDKGLRRIQGALRRARIARATTTVRLANAKPNPLRKGAYGEALSKLQRLQRKLFAATDADAALRLMEEINKTLMATRKALWDQKAAAMEREPPPAKRKDR